MNEAYIREIDELKAENAKLRRLLARLVGYAESADRDIHYYRFRGVPKAPTLEEYRKRYGVEITTLSDVRAALAETEPKK